MHNIDSFYSLKKIVNEFMSISESTKGLDFDLKTRQSKFAIFVIYCAYISLIKIRSIYYLSSNRRQNVSSEFDTAYNL